jgi:hypothetical protein
MRRCQNAWVTTATFSARPSASLENARPRARTTGEDVEEAGAHARGRDVLRLGAAEDGARSVIRGHGVERPALGAPVREVRVRDGARRLVARELVVYKATSRSACG